MKPNSPLPNDTGALVPGKVPARMLTRLLGIPRHTSPTVLVGPSLGEDAAVVNLESRLVAVASDPITFPTPRPGYYAVHVNANDIAVMGGKPEYFTLTMIMPPGVTYDRIEAIMRDAIEAADSLPAVLIGGHSEVSAAVSTPVVAVTMIGRLASARPLCTGGGKPGDVVIQTGPLAVEGTSILVVEHRDRLVESLGSELVDKAARFIYDPGISVVAPARLAARELDVTAMHDPTEGGLATGLLEVALASGTGLFIEKGKLLILEETRKICNVLGYDPLGIFSSGCLIFTVPPGEADKAVSLMNANGFTTAQIGRLTEQQGIYELVHPDGSRIDLPRFDVDEMARE